MMTELLFKVLKMYSRPSKKITLLLVLISVVWITLSCGPMNKLPSSDEKSVLSSVGGSLSKNNLFSVLTKNSTPTEMGDNTFFIRCFHASDLKSTASESKISVSYWMPSMPEMGKDEVQATQLLDGRHEATLFFSMEGTWEITLKITEDSLQDEYVFEVSF